MDAYLSREACRSLEALSLLSHRTRPDGLLLGHKRGCRYIVENIFPSQRGFFPSFEKYLLLDQLFQNRILGFFSFAVEEKKLRKILKPFAHGKLFLDISPDKRKKMEIKSFVIEYEDSFVLLPIPLKF